MKLSEERQKYLDTIAPIIQRKCKQHGFGVPSAIIGQCMKESKFGTSDKVVNPINGKRYENHLGIKYKNEKRVPISIGYFSASTYEEYTKGTLTLLPSAYWYKFASIEDCIEGYFQFLENAPNDRYGNLRGVRDSQTYCNLIKADGYATGADYNISLFNDYVLKYELQRYDNIWEDKLNIDTDIEYIVCKGDTLSKISRKYGIDIDIIIARNNIANKNKISVGQKLYIPINMDNAVDKLNVGDIVILKNGATYYNGKAIPNWVFNSTLYYRGTNANGIIISTKKNPNEAITGVVKKDMIIVK